MAEHDRVRESEALCWARISAARSAIGWLMATTRDSHRADRVPRIGGATGAGEGHERFAVGARGREQGGSGAVGLIDVLDGLLVVGVGGVQQSDQDAGVEDQCCHSSRRRSSSPAG